MNIILEPHEVLTACADYIVAQKLLGDVDYENLRVKFQDCDPGSEWSGEIIARIIVPTKEQS